jgi:hypothetical protein
VVDWQASGVVALTGRSGGPGRIPAGSAATAANRLANALERLSGGIGSPVRVHGAKLLAERSAFTGWRGAGQCSAGGFSRLLPASDGWLAVSLPRPDDGALVAAMVADDGPVDPTGQTDPIAPWLALRRWVASRPAADTVVAATELGLAVGQLAEVSAPAASGPAGSGPLDVASLVAALTASEVTLPVIDRPARSRPLRVLDFSALWAGPLCAQLLGLAGADVVKFETPGRPDGARGGSVPFYDLLHAGHSSLRLDPADRAELALLHELVAAADVIIEASRPRALVGWGLSADQAVAGGGVWVSITAHGRTGPPAGRIGFGDDIAVAGGLVAWDEGQPIFAGDAIADPLAGLAAATGALLALATGEGRRVDVAMSEVVAATVGDRPTGPASSEREPAATAASSSGAAELVQTSIAEPVARAVSGPASGSGADTADVLSRWLPA